MSAPVAPIENIPMGNDDAWNGPVGSPYDDAGSQRLAMRTGSSANTNLKWLVGDHLGSTSVTADYAGTLISRTLYKPWGEVRYQSGTLPTKYTYTGQYSHTGDFGLMFYVARWYDPVLGRFAQADTIVPGAGKPLAWDRYAYALNSPIRYTDPTGHFSEDEMCKYWGYCGDGAADRAREVLGEALFGIMWGTSIGFGDLLIYNEGKSIDMFVLYEQEDGSFAGGIWSVTGKGRVSVAQLKEIQQIAGYSYDPDKGVSDIEGTVTRTELFDWFGGVDPKLSYTADKLSTDANHQGYSFYTYTDVGGLFWGGSAFSIIGGFTPFPPIQFAAGVVALGLFVDTVGFGGKYIGGPIQGSYPVVHFSPYLMPAYVFGRWETYAPPGTYPSS
jgi:RHS repeat-associated protein